MRLTRWILVGAAAALLTSPAFATTYWGGFEDTSGSGANGLAGTPFWNNTSLDGAGGKNVGFAIYGGGAINGGTALAPGYQYLATATGGSVNDVYFSVTGDVT